MPAVVLSVATSLAWGIADFLGGTSARRIPLAWVVWVSQVAGLALTLAGLAVLWPGAPSAETIVLGLLAGTAGALGVASLYGGMAIGTIGVVGALGALGVAIPVVSGVLSGEAPTPLVWGGIVVATAGVVVVTRAEGGGGSGRSVLLGLTAALGFGVAQTLIDAAAEGIADQTDAIIWTLAVIRIPVTVVLGAYLAAGRGGPPPQGRRWPWLVAVGVFDLTAVVLFTIATTVGELPVVAVLSSLYPAVAAVLAAVVLKERLSSAQAAGALMALAGVLVLAAGS